MAERVIQWRGTRDDLRKVLRSIPTAISGKGPDPLRLREGIAARIGFVWFSLVLPNFDTLGRGGVGADGDKWPPNTPAYLAYQKGRFKDSDKATSYRTNRVKHLDAKTKRIWAKANREAMKELRAEVAEKGFAPTARGVIRKAKEIKAQAAIIAWAATRKAGSETLIDFYPKQADTVLVDNGDLRRSIQPGVLTSATYSKADPNQVYNVEIKDVVVGTKDPKAAFHHASKKLQHGDGRKGTVRRRLWPEELPERWLQEMTDEITTFLLRIPEMLTGGRR